MKRRTFIAVAAAWPLLIRRAFADICVTKSPVESEADTEQKKREAAASAQRKAAVARELAAGHTVLILTIPDDDQAVWDRGRAFGEWLNHGSDAQLAPLDRASVLCARKSELPATVDGDPLMVLLRKGSTPRALEGHLPRYTDTRIVRILPPGETPPPDDDTVFAQRVELLSNLAADELGPAGTDAAALAGRVRARIVTVDPPEGAHWGNDSGCATRVEATRAEKEAARKAEEEERKRGEFHMRRIVGIGCGMGHVPEKSRRFLYFLARDPETEEI